MSAQVELNFEGGLRAQFPEFRDVVKASVYSCGRPFKAVAADLDMSVSELSRKLNENPNDNVHFPLDRLADLITATEDHRPIFWLAEKFLEDPETRRRRSIDQLAQLLPAIQAAIEGAK